MKANAENYRSECPLAIALELIGDKWSLVIVRDLCLGKSKYGDFQRSPEGIPTNILAKRLRELESNGIIIKQAYQDNPPRYSYYLTQKGADLLPIVQQMVIWTQKYVPNCLSLPESFFQMKPENLLNISQSS